MSPRPVVRDFMREALADVPPIPFRAPPGIKLVRVNHKTGLPAGPGDKTAILEAFKPGQEPCRLGRRGSRRRRRREVASGADDHAAAADAGRRPMPADAGAGAVAPPPRHRVAPPPANDRALTSGTGGLY